MGPRPTNGVENSEPISSAIVKYNYQAQQLDELSLVKGSRVMILEKSGDGWWRGQYGNKVSPTTPPSYQSHAHLFLRSDGSPLTTLRRR